MCEFKSMVVCRERILYSTKHDAHRRLLEDAGIRDTDESPDFVKIELVPLNKNYEDLDSYVFRIDQSYLPDWWNSAWAEQECREILKRIMVFPLVDFPGDLHIYSNAKLDAPVLKTVGGDLRIYSGAKLGVPALKTVGGYLRIYGAKLDAPALKTVGGDLRVYSGAKLGVPALKTVGGYLHTDNAKLDAPALKTVGGYLHTDNAKLDAPVLKTVGGKPYLQK